MAGMAIQEVKGGVAEAIERIIPSDGPVMGSRNRAEL